MLTPAFLPFPAAAEDRSTLPSREVLRLLSDASLVARLLRIPEGEASNLLLRLGGLPGLVGTEAAALLARGVSSSSVAILGALVELAARLAREEIPGNLLLGNPKKAATYLQLRYAGSEEVLGALFLDCRGLVIAEEIFFRGTIDRVAVSPVPILRAAFALQASAIVLFHNHPSGNARPSGEDTLLTRRMAESCDLVGLKLVDHLVLGSAQTFSSIREAGW